MLPTQPKPLIIAHRGIAQTNPENTIAAFEAAIALQADMIEFDVRSTKDHRLIIHHDPNIDRTPIAQLTWAELQTLNSQIPTLEATLQCCRGRIRLDVELKEIGQEEQTIAMILQHLTPDDFVITSFNFSSLQVIRQRYPEIIIGLLLKRSLSYKWQQQFYDPNFKQRQAQIKQLQPNFLAPNEQLWNTKWLQQINVDNLPYWFWTVNQPARMADLINLDNVEAMITDRVDLALATRQTEINHLPH